MKDLPLGIYTFEDIIKGDALYIDKTAYLYNLVNSYKAVYFLSRPRRFGKSLTLSSLKAIFEGKKELFNGLAIYDKPYNWQQYPVIHISMATMENSTVERLENSLLELVNHFAEKFNVTLSNRDLAPRFLELICLMAEKEKVVLLIDEYDKPILDNIEDINESKKILRLLKGFYGVIKSADPYLRFALLAGVSKFSKVSLFSDLNNLYDLTMDADYATMLGVTQTELENYFAEAIDKVAVAETLSHDATINKIKQWYNGYRFSEDNITVYNPVSVMSLFQTLKFKNYWFETGTPTFLLKLLKKYDYDIRSLDNMNIDQIGFSSYEIDNLTPEPLLFQTGYITIKNYDKTNELYTLGYPNSEVKKSFLQYLSGSFTPVRKELTAAHIVRMLNAIQNNNLKDFFATLKVFFANVPYDIQLTNEKYYQTIFYIIFTLLGLYIKAESRTNKGRIDAVVESEINIYIFEFKLHDSATTALQQINDKRYYEKYLQSGKQIILVGVGFDQHERNIGEYLSREL